MWYPPPCAVCRSIHVSRLVTPSPRRHTAIQRHTALYEHTAIQHHTAYSPYNTPQDRKARLSHEFDDYLPRRGPQRPRGAEIPLRPMGGRPVREHCRAECAHRSTQNQSLPAPEGNGPAARPHQTQDGRRQALINGMHGSLRRCSGDARRRRSQQHG